MDAADDYTQRQKQHAQEVALAREAQRQATHMSSDGAVSGPTLSQARRDVARQGLEAETEQTKHEVLLREVDRRIEDGLKKLRVVGPAVSGDYRSGWSINAGSPDGDPFKQSGQLLINGVVYDVVFLLSVSPVVAP